jgi:hypothetical protein
MRIYSSHQSLGSRFFITGGSVYLSCEIQSFNAVLKYVSIVLAENNHIRLHNLDENLTFSNPATELKALN